MEAKLFTQMLADKNICNLRKLQYKFSIEKVSELIELLKGSMYKSLPIRDFKGENLVYLDNLTQISMNSVKLLLTPQSNVGGYGLKAMEDEIHSTFTIENINSSRESIRRILNGYAPTNDDEDRIYGMKKGLEFISDLSNKITEANLNRLYQLTIGEFLEEDNKLLPDQFYRHDTVYIVGDKVEHEGLPFKMLPEYMSELIEFIDQNSKMNELLKAAAIHFYIAYLHPYFDGNGRMARLIHLWYLVQQGYSSAMFIPFSKYVNESRKAYYSSYTLIEQNEKISGVIDITPFLIYFIENVYNKLGNEAPGSEVLQIFQEALKDGKITEKEKDLWNFVLSAYGANEFSTKQVEKDFGNAAYATIRGFVLKFESLGLLSSQKYGCKVKYRII